LSRYGDFACALGTYFLAGVVLVFVPSWALADNESAPRRPTRPEVLKQVADEPLPPELPPPRAIETSSVAGDSTGPAPPPEAVHIGNLVLPTQLGPAWIDAGVGRLRLGLGMQLRANVFSQEDDGSRETQTAVLIRRLRISIAGRFLNDRLTFGVQLNTAPGNFEVVDVWIDAEFFNALRLRVGQFKIPFDWYRNQSYTQLLLVDWSIASVWFGSERQFGVMTYGAIGDSGLDYRFGVFTGQNRRASFAIRLPSLYGEPLLNPSRVDGVGEVDSVHPELVGSIRYRSEKFSDGDLSDGAGGDPRYMMALSGAYDFNPELARDQTSRLALEGWLQLHHVSLVSAAYLSFIEATQTRNLGFGAVGANLEAAYRFRQDMEVSMRYAIAMFGDRVLDDAQARGQGLIAGAQTLEEADALAAQYGNAGQQKAEQELLLGFNYYFIGHSLKLQSDVGWIRRTLRERAEDDFRFRTHIQLAL
jgi:hypothetical protein